MSGGWSRTGTRKRRAREIVVLPGAEMEYDRAARWVGRQREHLIGDLAGEHVDLRAGGGQQLRFPGGGSGAAGQHCTLARQSEKDG